MGMHLSAELGKVWVWSGRQDQEPLCCAFKHTVTLGRYSCHSGITSQSESLVWSASQKGCRTLLRARLQAWFYLGAGTMVLCAVLWMLLQGAVRWAWVNWKAMTWWARGCCPQMGRSGLWGTDTSVAGPPQSWIRTHSQMPCPVKSHEVFLSPWTQVPLAESLCSVGCICVEHWEYGALFRSIFVIKVTMLLIYLWKTGCQVQRGLVSSRSSALCTWYSGLRYTWS